MPDQYEEKGEIYDEAFSQTPNWKTFRFVRMPKSFSQRKTTVQKRTVKGILRGTTKDSLDFDADDAGIGEKERIMVFEQGNYSMEEAVYDQETKIPKHLRARKEQKVQD